MPPAPLCSFWEPLQNPLGFGIADVVEIGLAALLLAGVFAGARVPSLSFRFARQTGWCMLLLACLPVVLRLALLNQSPVPIPSGVDDFSHVLVGETLAHLRLANPTHPFHRFFETNFVLQEPSYSSIFPIGQGLALAAGNLVFGHPWPGVVLSVAVLCAAAYWMLRGWTAPEWALVGGILCVCEFGPLKYWMNTYWGGAVSAIAGCLVFGALPRLRAAGKKRHAALLGLGLGLQLLARPFEALLVALGVAFFFLTDVRISRKSLVLTAVAALALAPAIALTVLHNHQVTGDWKTMPYMVSRYQYGVPTTFTFQPNAVPHRKLTQEQQLDYDVQAAVHGPDTDTPAAYLRRLASRVRFYRFFFFAPLYLVLPFFLFRLREHRFVWVTLCLLLFALGTNFYPYFYPHYLAAATCLFLLVTVTSLEQLSRWQLRGRPVGVNAARLLVVLCLAHFVFFFGANLAGGIPFARAIRQYESWDFINHGDPEGRLAVNRLLERASGKQLVFVRYSPRHRFDEWVQNAADIDAARVVWALDLGAVENEELLRYYPDRTTWLIEPDSRPPNLSRYDGQRRRGIPVPMETVPEPRPTKPSPGPKPVLQFEPVV